jgi:hypothetical protein
MPKNQIEHRSSIDYILDRTFFRPREAIIFLNECISRSEGQARVGIQLLRKAEIYYSEQRLRSLANEWRLEYPCLSEATALLTHREIPFTIESITTDECQRFAEKILAECKCADDPVFHLSEEFYTSGGQSQQEFLMGLIEVFYHVGLVGIKLEAHHNRQWSFEDEPLLARGRLRPSSSIDVHKTFWGALGTIIRARGSQAVT